VAWGTPLTLPPATLPLATLPKDHRRDPRPVGTALLLLSLNECLLPYQVETRCLRNLRRCQR
jgi:hypothetical protein